jgi:hypothetical protein
MKLHALRHFYTAIKTRSKNAYKKPCHRGTSIGLDK